MFQNISIQWIECGVIYVWLQHSLAQVVMHDHARSTSQSPEGPLMKLRPPLGARRPAEKANRFAAVAQSEDEQPRAAVLPGLRVADPRPFPVVDLSFLARRCLDHRPRLNLRGALQRPDEASNAMVAAAKLESVHQVLVNGHCIPPQALSKGQKALMQPPA